MIRRAYFSECGTYRYLLQRVWDPKGARTLIIMLNPSTADAYKDDATIRSCIRLCRALGFGGFEVANLMAYRATNPKDLPNKPSLCLGAGNPRYLAQALERCGTVICAWGAHPYAAQFAGGALDIVKLYDKRPYCFGVNKNGSPKHPLYVNSKAQLIPYGGMNA